MPQKLKEFFKFSGDLFEVRHEIPEEGSIAVVCFLKECRTKQLIKLNQISKGIFQDTKCPYNPPKNIRNKVVFLELN